MDELNQLAEDPNLWSDPEKAQAVMRERTLLDAKISTIRRFEMGVNDNVELISMGEDEDDDAIIAEAESALNALHKEVQKYQLESLLSGEADQNDAYLEVNAGAGGTEAQDWGAILLRMYTRWGERRKFKVSLLDRSEGEEAGIKSATIKIEGLNAYGWLKTETGVHRLVRISPFDSAARRHTSFASVTVTPYVDDNIEVEINPSDLRVDTYRSSGAGGQHVNTTDSAIRITHIPTGIVVACQTERSQHQNRANAMSLLKARIYEAELRKREEASNAIEAQKTDIGWGHQIRSYVLQPYQMIKDARTGTENTNSQAVLDGDIDLFLETSLAHRLGISDKQNKS
jgi:peptide chain release factor 2